MKKKIFVLFSLILCVSCFCSGCFGLDQKGYEIVNEDIGYISTYNGKVYPCVILEINNTSNSTLSICADINIYCDGALFDSVIAGQKSGGLLVLLPGDTGELWGNSIDAIYQFEFNAHEWTYKITDIDVYYD